MIIAKGSFYESYRKNFGKIMLSKTVVTINTIIDYCIGKDIDISKIAYILATASHEARHQTYQNDFYPIVERGSWTYITKKYWYNKKVRGWLGNKSILDAWTFRGRGLVQITGRTNYKKFGLENNPQEALNLDVAVKVLVDGMMEKRFTGVGLGIYINDSKKDYVRARKVVNGLDRAHDIAEIARDFERMLRESILLSVQ